MSHKHVTRRAGWDCHGLPVEYEIDQTLNITSRDQVLAMGIDQYNATCRGIVTRYTQEWEATITRLGRWIDFKNDYKTMDPTFMESVWWVFSQLYNKGLVYQGHRVMPYSTACTTPLSNFEAGLNYKDVKDPAVVVSFPLVDQPDTHLVAWTTTPWTLPSNIALCANAEMEYVEIVDKKSSRHYILAKTRLPQLYPVMTSKKWKPEQAAELYEVVRTFLGSELVGKRYQPLFDYFVNSTEESKLYFQVLSDSYVTDDAGTGIVHQAPAFGEDDYRVCLAHGLIRKGGSMPCPVNDDGNFTAQVPPVTGMHVKQADETLIGILKEQGRLVQKDVLLHSYPFCWRSDTPLIYKAVHTWFVKVEEFRDRIVENNKQTYWVPNEIKEGRFHNWLADARDWNISRNRFWGTPIPIWSNEDFTELVCVGSIAELAELSGQPPVQDLHRETVDNITIPSRKNPGTNLKRIEEVFDCWFESGSMPYAQSHYPFENKDVWEKGFPADFIAEGLDQTRGWFYTLMVLSTALFDKPAFKNNIVNGLVMAADGQKMSKRKKNYPDPTLVINKYGADALRLYLINSPVVRAESLRFREDGVLGVVKEVFLPLYNAFRFFMQNVERWESGAGRKFSPSVKQVHASANPTDIWVQAETQRLIKFMHDEMGAYRLYTVTPALVKFGTQLTNWYVRLNRDRLKGLEGEGEAADIEAETGLQVLYSVLLDVATIMAPFTPFIAEYLYLHLRKLHPAFADAGNGGGTANPVGAGKSDSVHFLRLPKFDEDRLNKDAVESMEALQSIVEQGRNAREKRNISLRTPVKSVVAVLRNPGEHVVTSITGPLKKYILSELNAWDFTVVPKEQEHDWVTLSLLPNFKALGKKLGKKLPAVQKKVKSLSHEVGNDRNALYIVEKSPLPLSIFLNQDAVKCLAEGTLEVEGIVLETATELESKLDFSKDGANWEATSKLDGSLVVALDCTQDEAIITAGRSRELINGIQQLRKSAGLDLKDVVEVFFSEEEGVSIVEEAVSKNVAAFQSKFKGAVPLPLRFAPEWAVSLKTDTLEVGGTKVVVSICRPSIAASSSVDEKARKVLSTFGPQCFSPGQSFSFSVDGKSWTLQEGKDFFLSSSSLAQHTKAVDWL